jgi:hypothetical protein
LLVVRAFLGDHSLVPRFAPTDRASTPPHETHAVDDYGWMMVYGQVWGEDWMQRGMWDGERERQRERGERFEEWEVGRVVEIGSRAWSLVRVMTSCGLITGGLSSLGMAA